LDGLPFVAIDGEYLLAVSGTDFASGAERSTAVASSNGAAKVAKVDLPINVYGPVAAVVGDRGVVAGTECRKPESGDRSCDDDVGPIVIQTVDLDTGDVLEPVETGLRGILGPAVGGPQSTPSFIVIDEAGRHLLTQRSGSWATLPLPQGVTSVCRIDKTLLALSPASPLAEPSTAANDPGAAPATVPAVPITPVAAGDAMARLYRSDDDGRSWNDGPPLRAEDDRQLAFAVGGVCGPTSLIALTANIARFNPESSSWMSASVPIGDQFQPGSASTWLSDDTILAWTLPTVVDQSGAEDALPRTSARALAVSFDGKSQRSVDEIRLSIPESSSVVGVGWASPRSPGWFLTVGDSIELWRAS